MTLIRNAVGISKLLLILLLVIAFIVGAVLSYMWTMGYYISLGLRLPEAPTVVFDPPNATFDPQNPTYFNITLLNPSVSPSSAIVKDITVSTEYVVLQDKVGTYPTLGPLSIGESKTFTCFWNWANYTGQTIKISAYIKGGSGPTIDTKTPIMDLKITDVCFNPAVSVTHFNMTVQNSPSSVTYFNITNVKVDTETVQNVTPSIPYMLHLNDSVSFMCLLNWTDYQGKNVKVTVGTSQGYAAHRTLATSKPVLLEITNVLFDITDTSPYFNVTVHNSEKSPTYVNVTAINATVKNVGPLNVIPITPFLPQGLPSDESQVFMCSCNWTGYRNESVRISVHTRQGFTKYLTTVTPATVVLEISAVQFSAINATRLDITIRNSRISLEDVSITHITVTVEGGTPENITEVTPSLPYTLHINELKTFACTWNWGDYGGKNATFTAYAVGYSAKAIELVPGPVIVITGVVFDSADPTHFSVTIRNPTSLTYAHLTYITATLEDGAVQNVAVVGPPYLPHILHPNQLVTFTCLWNWAEYCGQNVTINVNTLRGYVASYRERVPPIIINITKVLFDAANTTCFNVTVRNSEFSVEEANITKITATMENGTTLEITQTIPSLPSVLSPNSSVTFTCSWNWTNYQDKNVTITVYTLEGYRAFLQSHT